MESDAEFVERMTHIHPVSFVWEDLLHLLALARRGAAMADHERKMRQFIGNPMKGVYLPPPPALGEPNE